MSRKWNEVQIILNEVQTPDEKLHIVLEDIWSANHISDESRKINLFIGRAKWWQNSKKGYIHQICTVLGDTLFLNPYGGILSVSIGQDYRFLENQGVVFTASAGELDEPLQIIVIDEIKTFDELGIKTDDEVINRLLEGNFFPQYNQILQGHKMAKQWPHEFQQFMDQKTTVSDLQKKTTKLRHEVMEWEKEKQDVEERTNKIKQEEKELRGSIDSLRVAVEDAKAKKEQTDKDIQSAEAQLSAYHNQIKVIRERYSKLFPISTGYDYLNGERLKIQDPNALLNIKSRLEYLYGEKMLVSFLMALSTFQIIALCGDPGTGKTTFARQMANALGAKFHLIEVQNNWTDRSDVLGFYNPTNGSYQSTSFLDALIEARDDEEENGINARLHIICLDEMNLSRVEYYFATFLSLLQQKPEDRNISILPWDVMCKLSKEDSSAYVDNGLLRYQQLYIPSNVRFVGTMNMDDTAQNLSPKVIDRCFFIEFNKLITADKNDTFNMTDAYYPASNFSEIWSPSDMKEIDQELSRISADPTKGEKGFTVGQRLRKYARCMWPCYHLLEPESSINEYIDLLLCRKVLPSINSVSQVSKIKTDFPMVRERFEVGQARGKLLHPYDTDSWSYWE